MLCDQYQYRKTIKQAIRSKQGKVVSLHHLLNTISTIQFCADRITNYWRSKLELGLYLTCCDTILIRLQKSTKDVFRALAADANNSARVCYQQSHTLNKTIGSTMPLREWRSIVL